MIENFGIAITTRNRSEWCKSLFEVLKNINNCKKISIVNDGPSYEWVPVGDNVIYTINETNLGVAKTKNKAIRPLLDDESIKYVFTIEDDIVIKNTNVFEEFIIAHQKTNLPYFSYPSHSWDSGKENKRTPIISIDYGDIIIDFYPHMVAAFNFYTKELLKTGGLYDERYFRIWFDVDHIFHLSKRSDFPPFWYFPCIQNIDSYLHLIPESLNQSEARSADEEYKKQPNIFFQKHGILVNSVPRCTIDELKEKLRRIKLQKGG